MAGKGISKSLVWILMGMLILGLGGFGVTNLSGTVRSVGSVGDSEIDINQYARALQTEIRALEAERGEAISFAQAQQLGVDQNVLSRLVAIAALDDETHQMGISIGDENLRSQIVDIAAFKGLDGKFDREAYTFALEQAGLTEAQFEEETRAQSARTLLQAAVVSGVNTPDTYTDALLSYLAERRSITWAVLERDNLVTGLPAPTDEDLIAYHQANKAEFTSPQVKRITYAWLTPEMIVDTIEVDEDSLRATYEERLEEFSQPERRLLERLAFPDAAAAKAALDRINGGESFEDIVAERGLDLTDIDMGDVGIAELEAAGEDVFAAEVGEITGPLDSPVGPALFRVNAVLKAHKTTFEEALPQLRDELASDRARRVIEAQIDGIDDLLAGGATIEDLSKETDLELGQIDWHADKDDGIGAYEAFQASAAALSDSDYPEVVQLDDGGIFAMRLDEVVEPALRPLEDIRDQVVEAWRRQATVKALHAQAEADLLKLNEGSSFEDLGMLTNQVQDLTRQGFQPGTPADFIETVFGMEKGATRIIDGTGRVFILRLDDIQPPDENSDDVKQLRKALQDQAAGDLSQDLFQAMANDIRGRVGIQLNQQALNAVHANFQ
ncbi:Peptidyl-prolyl cis-trans isomerase D [Roseovarius litorisediminis]|uniref:Parvulin-like PPIase n=1 Tax=Roseovarius litorisediminis TaxID=1312363 RepID=A0A1Y5RDP2_9RHOB|nr:peptidyl-prolyl cis-trans isomerase [Roseovarius litorisediminis]SLN14817.1 Peptidyl-prolyl cis-trans isomerase D [Roseovarius litorisediminis]